MRIIILLALLVATACAPIAIEAGCAVYGNARLSMPPLGTDPLSEWAATTDSAMTGACR